LHIIEPCASSILPKKEVDATLLKKREFAGDISTAGWVYISPGSLFNSPDHWVEIRFNAYYLQVFQSPNPGSEVGS